MTLQRGEAATVEHEGEKYAVYREENGKVHLLNASTGEIVNSLQLTTEEEGATLQIKASPAVYANLVLIGTTGTKAGGVYCLKID